MLVAIDIAGGLEALGFTRPPEPVTSGHWGLLENMTPGLTCQKRHTKPPELSLNRGASRHRQNVSIDGRLGRRRLMPVVQAMPLLETSSLQPEVLSKYSFPLTQA